MKRSSSNRLIFFSGIMLIVSSCARITEPVKLIMGTSTNALEETKERSGIAKTFAADYHQAYNIVSEVLKRKKITIFLHSIAKGRIVAMNFLGEPDTTEIGIFFDAVDSKNTKITVASLSRTHQALVSSLIFSEMAKELALRQEEVKK